VEKIVEDTALTAVDGSRLLTLDMKYRNVPLDADTIASNMLALYKQKDTLIDRIDLVANRSEYLMMSFLALQVGDKISVINSRAGINAEYFINGKSFNIEEGGIIKYSYILSPEAYG